MENFDFLLFIAIILGSTKILGLISQKVHMPQVLGALTAGVILGPSILNLVVETDFLSKSAEIGVIMLMFLAGLDTDIEELKKTGFASFTIALIGVILPIIGGFFTYLFFFSEKNSDGMETLRALFIGVVLTATSVSITVETLRELGYLKGRMGTAILGAAIIDDIIGIIVLTVITSFRDTSVQPEMVFLKIALYFVFIIIAAFVIHLFAKYIEVNDNHRRVAVISFVFCILVSYISEKFFGIADITGAYFAGIILCNMGIRDYVAKRVSITSYMIFSPIFFASIGIKTDINSITSSVLIFTIVLTIVAILSKILGCGIGARFCKFSLNESICIGIGMVSRGEVALVVAQKGAQFGLLDSKLFPSVVIVVVVTTLMTPIFLKIFLAKKNKCLN